MFWEVFAALLTAQPVGDAPGIRGIWSTVDNLVHAPSLAVTCGKLMGMNQDQLGNAISLAMVGHVALGVDHWDGPNSMTKSNHDPELCRAVIFAAICAREGMTGPAQPFEGAKGFWDVITGPFDMKLPSGVGGNPMRPLPPGDKRYVAQTVQYKSVPGNGSSSGICQTILANLDEYKKLVPAADDIASIDIEINQWGDSEDPGKWDPLNSETADHSPYMVARTLLDWELWESSFAIDKLTEPAVRKVMEKITLRENPGRKGTLFTVRNKSGAEITKMSAPNKEMTVEEVNKKFERICSYKGVTDAQRDRIRSTWADLRNVKDIADPIRETLAHFGKPVAL
jgi:2-methylcitrate dehydratase PrpD